MKNKIRVAIAGVGSSRSQDDDCFHCGSMKGIGIIDLYLYQEIPSMVEYDRMSHSNNIEDIAVMYDEKVAG